MMVFDEKLSWVRIVLKRRGSVLRHIWGRLLVVLLVATAVTVADQRELLEISLTTTPFSLIGLALSIFLGFRNNTSYQRFWEGRILWGRLVNTSRTLTRQLRTLVNAPPDAPELADEVTAFQRDAVHRVAAYIHALRLHLRDERNSYGQLRRLVPSLDGDALVASSNAPIALLHDLGLRLRDAWRKGWIDTYHLPVLEQSLSACTDHQGGCERIKSTPIPFSYTLLIHRISAVYCLALPFGIVGTVGVITPLVTILVSYAFFGLDAIGDEIENPFGHDRHDLPLSAITTMIETNVREPLPPQPCDPAPCEPVRPVKNVLA